MAIPLNERRGLNRQDAIDYLGIKGTFFDREVRPKLTGMRMGTSVVFDRTDLDTVFDQIKMAAGDVGPTEKGVHGWPKEPLVSPKQKTAVGESTSTTMELDFKAVLKRLRKQKAGC